MFGLSLSAKAVFFRQLSSLIESGVPIMGAMEALGKMPNPAIKKVVRIISPMVREGKPLSEALGKFPQYFEEVTIQLVKAGEVGGTLDIRLNDIADYLERINTLRQQFISRMIYPLILVHAGIFIPPIFILVLKGLGAYLKATLVPLTVIYALVIGIYMLYKMTRKVPGLRESMDAIFLYIPFIGRFFKDSATYRFLLIMGDMSEAGVNIDVAVEAAANACGNTAAKTIFLNACKKLSSGYPLSSCLEKTRLVPEMTLQLIRTGEESGNLPKMMKKASQLMGQNLKEVTNRIFAVLPVLFYLMIACYVGYVIISTFVKIYKPIFDQNFP